MSSPKVTPEEQIAIIRNSLKHTASQKTGARNYNLIWGTILFAYFIAQFFNAYFKTNITATIANFSTMFFVLGGLLSFFQSKKDDTNETIVPLNERVYKFAWIGASICYGVMCFVYVRYFIEIYCIGVLLIFGLVNFIIGGISNFRPLLIGGLISMLLNLLIVNVPIEYKYLTTAIGIVFSLIIPGYLMKNSKANV